MEKYNKKKVKAYNKKGSSRHLYKMSWTLTPDETCILEGALPFYPHNLKDLGKLANSHMLEFWEKQGEHPMGNILLVDFFETSSVVEVTKRINGIKPKRP